MPSDEEFRELKDQVASLSSALATARRRIDDLEDGMADHLGLDWGESLVDVNSPHPNISANTIESGGGKIRQDAYGMQVQSDGTDFTAIYGVEKLVADPSAEADVSVVRFNVTGGGDIETSIEASANNQATTSLLTLHAGNDGRKWLFTESPLLLNAPLTPATITGDQNNYSPTGLASAQVLRLASDASRTITGINGGLPGRVLFIINIGANDIILSNENASSTAELRFAIGADVTLGASESCILWYDNTSTRWRMVGKHV